MSGLLQKTGWLGLRDAVPYGRPGPRAPLGQTIRSIAGAIASLLIAVTALPADAGLTEDWARTSAPQSRGMACLDECAPSAKSEEIASAALTAPILACLAETSLAEAELVAELTEPASPPNPPTLDSLHAVRFAAGIAACSPTSLDAAGPLWTRAPPLD